MLNISECKQEFTPLFSEQFIEIHASLFPPLGKICFKGITASQKEREALCVQSNAPD